MPSLQMIAKLLNNQTLEALKHPLDTPKRYLGCAAASPNMKSPLGQAVGNPKFEDFSFPASPQGSRSPTKRSIAKLQTVVAEEATRKKSLAGDAVCLDGSTAPVGSVREGSEGTSARPPAAAEEQRQQEGLHAGAERLTKLAEGAHRSGPYPSLLGQDTRGEPQRDTIKPSKDADPVHVSAHEAYLAKLQRIDNRRLPLQSGASLQKEPSEAQPLACEQPPRLSLRPSAASGAVAPVRAEAGPRPARGFPSLLGHEEQEAAEALTTRAGAEEEPQTAQEDAATSLGTRARAAFLARRERRNGRCVATPRV